MYIPYQNQYLSILSFRVGSMASDFSICMIFSGFITSEMRELLKNHRINILNHGGYMFTLWAQSSQRVDVGVTENF